eukprot:GHVR01001689.1.p1 GENE.GHVR01001689.1~~GHVR01001689.1.p1  ORF type:complete len:116 (-),score=46.63 GHVR01001689.1:337-684(-)
MGLIQAGTIVGVIVGYLVAGLMNVNGVHWRYSIWILVLLMSPYVLLMVPFVRYKKYINIPETEKSKKKEIEGEMCVSSSDTIKNIYTDCSHTHTHTHTHTNTHYKHTQKKIFIYF